ncbi:MAG: hypothetical protein IJI22_05280 [Bacilli bacterium]|nr:hypothetical protein [Bacilli bacterium]
MTKPEELIYKLFDADYSLTEEDKNLLTISLFILIKEQIIKKDIPNKIVYFDCKNKEFIPLILEIGNKIKDILVNDKMPLDQTVSVELLNDYEYKTDREGLKKAIYYVHRLRDWLVHKDYELVGDKLFIMPFASDKGDHDYKIELDISDIEKLCNKKNTEFTLDLMNLRSFRLCRQPSKLFVVNGSSNRFIINPETGFVIIVDSRSFHNGHFNFAKIESDAKRILAGEKPEKKGLDVVDVSTLADGEFKLEEYVGVRSYIKKQKVNAGKITVFKFGKVFSDEEATLRSILKKLEINKDGVNKNNYYLAAIYNYATNVYAENDKKHPSFRSFDISGFNIDKIDNQQFSDQNTSILNTIKSFNKLYIMRKNDIISAGSEKVQRKVSEKLLESLLELFQRIDKYLEFQKTMIFSSVRNSIDHGNINIDTSTGMINLYDTDDNTREINDNNCEIKITTDINTLHLHIDEYNEQKDKFVSINSMLEDVERLTSDKKTIGDFKQAIIDVIYLLIDEEIDLNKLSIDDGYLELKNKLVQSLVDDVRRIK